jgi:hypothetical protein
MAADPSSLALATPWRKSTRSGGTGCVEAALVAAVRRGPMADTAPVGATTSKRVASAGQPLP